MKALGGSLHKREGNGARGGTRARNISNGICMRDDGARGSWPSDQLLIQWGEWKWVFLSNIFFGFVKFVKFVN
jgi:hypothetical protein